jgi:RNA polymerase sigma factor (sigma-70 family)
MMLAMTSFEPHDPPAPAVAEAGADFALVRQAASGDLAAFERIYRAHSRRVYATILRLVGGDRGRAEDLTQEAFVRVWQKLAEFRFESAFSTWLHRLAVNVALMALRAGRAQVQADDDIDDEGLQLPESRPSAPDARIDLEALIPRLPPRARAVLLLHDVEGWQHDEIGKELGMAVGTSKAQLHRARGLLRQWMGVRS